MSADIFFAISPPKDPQRPPLQVVNQPWRQSPKMAGFPVSLKNSSLKEFEPGVSVLQWKHRIAHDIPLRKQESPSTVNTLQGPWPMKASRRGRGDK